MANLAEDLGRVALWLEKYPNLYIDIDARISELGRQPYTARKFMIKYQDRILFATDTQPNAEAYRVHYRFWKRMMSFLILHLHINFKRDG